MNKDEEIIDAMVTGIFESVDEAVEILVTKSATEIILEVVRDMLKFDSSMSTLKEMVKHDIIDRINTKIEVLVNERVNKAVEEAQLKAGLHAELEMAKKVSGIRADVVKRLEAHLEFRSREFEDFSSVLEQTCWDNGEDGLGAGGPHTTNLNIAHQMNDLDDEVLKRIVEQLQDDLPGAAEICEIETELTKMEEEAEEEEAPKEEVFCDDQ